MGNLGLIAAGFDDLGLEEVINACLDREGSHVNVPSGVLAKVLVMQMLNLPYQSLSGTEEYCSQLPLRSLTNQCLQAEDLDRSVLSKFLDDVCAYGSEHLFLKCASQTARALGLKIEEAHVETTSFLHCGS